MQFGLKVLLCRAENSVQRVRAHVQDSGIAPQELSLELTERDCMDHEEATQAVLAELRRYGVKINMDDFGTGYSSLSYLKRLPVDRLKIDRSFVRDIPDDKDDVAIVATIIAMARHLELQVLAEGVEEGVQLEFLRAHQCDEFQGLLLSRPVVAEEAERFLSPAARKESV